MSKSLSKDQVLSKLQQYCAKQDRCQSEVIKKLSSFYLDVEEKEEIINSLIDDRFLDEDRFVQTYVKSKFNQNKWGKNKIRYSLEGKQVGRRFIENWIDSIDEEQYSITIQQLIQSKNNSIKNDDELKRKHKIAQYLAGKGYESEIVWKEISNFFEG